VRAIKAVVLVLLGGCSGYDRPTGTAVAPDTILPRTEAVWGTLDGDDDLVFTHILSFAVDDQGRLFVHDLGQDIRVYASDGSYLRTLARRGRGPGEVLDVFVMAYGGGQLVAWDIGNARISIWNDALEFVTSFPPPRRLPPYDEASITFLDGGEIWLKLAPDRSMHGTGFPRPEYVRAWPQGPDTLWVHAAAAACDQDYDYSYSNGFWVDVRLPWFPSVVSALGPGGELYLGCNENFRFKRYTQRDSTMFSRRNRELRVTRDERAFFETMYTPSLGTLPEFRPEYSRIIPSPDGRVWVFEPPEPEPLVVSEEIQAMVAMRGFNAGLRIGRSGGHFSVFDESGVWIAVVPLPPDIRYSGFADTRGVVIRGDTLWALRTGEFGEQYIARYQVPIGPR
jgi:hypothetical protein